MTDDARDPILDDLLRTNEQGHGTKESECAPGRGIVTRGTCVGSEGQEDTTPSRTHLRVKAMEEGKNLERNLDELHGLWGAECHHSRYENKRDLPGSVAHKYREPFVGE